MLYVKCVYVYGSCKEDFERKAEKIKWDIIFAKNLSVNLIKISKYDNTGKNFFRRLIKLVLSYTTHAQWDLHHYRVSSYMPCIVKFQSFSFKTILAILSIN